MENLKLDLKTYEEVQDLERQEAQKLCEKIAREDASETSRDLELNDAQVRALTGLASGKRTKDVAEELDIAVGTVFNWRCQPKFKEELRRLQELCYQDCVDTLRGASLEAALTLTDIMRDSSNPPRDRLTAAKAILAQIKFDPSADTALDPTAQIVKMLEEMNK